MNENLSGKVKGSVCLGTLAAILASSQGCGSKPLYEGTATNNSVQVSMRYEEKPYYFSFNPKYWGRLSKPKSVVTLNYNGDKPQSWRITSYVTSENQYPDICRRHKDNSQLVPYLVEIYVPKTKKTFTYDSKTGIVKVLNKARENATAVWKLAQKSHLEEISVPDIDPG